MTLALRFAESASRIQRLGSDLHAASVDIAAADLALAEAKEKVAWLLQRQAQIAQGVEAARQMLEMGAAA